MRFLLKINQRQSYIYIKDNYICIVHNLLQFMQVFQYLVCAYKFQMLVLYFTSCTFVYSQVNLPIRSGYVEFKTRSDAEKGQLHMDGVSFIMVHISLSHIQYHRYRISSCCYSVMVLLKAQVYLTYAIHQNIQNATFIQKTTNKDIHRSLHLHITIPLVQYFPRSFMCIYRGTQTTTSANHMIFLQAQETRNNLTTFT